MDLQPDIALFGDEVGEVHAAVAAAGLEVEEGLGGSVKVEDGLQAVAGPLDGGDALGLGALEFEVALGEGGDVVDEHGVEDACFLSLLGAVAGVEVGGEALVLEDHGPGTVGELEERKARPGVKESDCISSRYDTRQLLSCWLLSGR